MKNKTFILITAVIAFFLVMTWQLLYNYNLWKADEVIYHASDSISRWAMLVVPFGLLVWYKTTLKKIFINLTFVIILFVVVVMMSSYYWFFYDGLFNVIRNFDWNFPGSIDVDESKTDNFLRHLTTLQGMILKISLMIASTFAYIKL